MGAREQEQNGQGGGLEWFRCSRLEGSESEWTSELISEADFGTDGGTDSGTDRNVCVTFDLGLVSLIELGVDSRVR